MNIYTATDRTPYTYLVTHVPSGKRYYGARYKIGCHPSDLWVSYFTSSKTIHALIASDKLDSFKIEVRRTFTSVAECRKWEYKVLHKLNVRQNENWFNKHAGGKEFYNTSHASPDTKIKMSIARLGKPKSDSMKQNAMWYYELKFTTGDIEYIKGKVNVLARLNRKDWDTIRNCIKCNNGFIPRSKVYIRRMPKIFSPQ
jgi:hypothetical protein